MKILTNISLIFLLISCANMVAPTGGDTDLDSPQLLNTVISEDSRNIIKRTIIFEFDEYVQLNRWEEYFYISPPIKRSPKKQIKGKSLLLTIEDTLNENTTYQVNLSSCIKDINEGNILDTLEYKFSTHDIFDTLTLSGTLQDAYTLQQLDNAWIMLFNEGLNDSLIFKSTPNYIGKTDKNGIFHFPNLKSGNYNIVALTDFDFIYNKQEKIAFLNRLVNPEIDSLISLFAFDPIISIDSISRGLVKLESDSIIDYSMDSFFTQEVLPVGRIKIITNEKMPCIFQLLQNEEVKREVYFSKKPYLIEGVNPGDYQLKFIADSNQDSLWNTGIWEMRIQPERVENYPSEITIRSNWNLELEWIIGE